MRTLVGSICLIFTMAMALAQGLPERSGDSPHSTGRTVAPETEGKPQPQGNPGPLDTTQGGAPAASPQGQTPPGMQSAPGGSSKTVVDPKSSGQQAGPNQTAKDTVPPATDKSEPSRAGTQEPSAKVEGTAQKGAFENGVLTAAGAPTDVDTAPAKFSDGIIMHPGGRKVLEAAETALALPREYFRHAWDVLADYGNMSSPTALFVLERTLSTGASGRHLLAAFGPGFTVSFALLDL